MSDTLALPANALSLARADPVVATGRVLRMAWAWILVPTLVAFAGSVAFVSWAPPRFVGEAQVLLEVRDSFFTRPSPETGDQPLIDEQAVASQVQVVLSRDLAREAVRRLSLAGNPEFDPLAAEPNRLYGFMRKIGFGKPPSAAAAEEEILERYYSNLAVYAVGRSRIVAIEFTSYDRELAARAANTIAELYLDLLEAAKLDTARSAFTWLGTNIEALRNRVTEAEAKVEEFRSRTGLLVGTNNATIAVQQLSDLNAQLAQARSVQAETQGKAQHVRNLFRSGRSAEIPDVANNELIRRLVEQRITLRAQLAFEQRTLLPGHPRMRELSSQIAELESQIRSAVERTARTLENDAEIATARVGGLQQAVDAQKRVVTEANEKEVQLRALEREARVQREQLESYLGRYREAAARDEPNASPADARIVSRAIVPQTPAFPKKGPTVAFATIAAFVLATGAVVTRIFFALAPSAPASGVPAHPVPLRPLPPPVPSVQPVPPQELPEDDPFFSQDLEPETIAQRLSGLGPSPRGRLIVVHSRDRPCIDNALATGIGRALAHASRVLLVDSETDGAPVRSGLSDLVSGAASFSSVIARDPSSRLHRVGAGRSHAAPGQTSQARLEFVFSAFAQTYDWVVCTTGKDGETIGATVVAGFDAMVVVKDAENGKGRILSIIERAAFRHPLPDERSAPDTWGAT